MSTDYPWGWDMIPSETGIGLENMSSDLTQGPGGEPLPASFDPANIVTESGLFYATIYVCRAVDESLYAQQLAIWFSSLRETDEVHLTVASLVLELPVSRLITLLGAIATTRGKIKLHLDTIITDGLAYFYLLVPDVVKGSEGALFIPSYVHQRDQDMSGPERSVCDFFSWIVDQAVERGRLTHDEATNLKRGTAVAPLMNRF